MPSNAQYASADAQYERELAHVTGSRSPSADTGVRFSMAAVKKSAAQAGASESDVMLDDKEIDEAVAAELHATGFHDFNDSDDDGPQFASQPEALNQAAFNPIYNTMFSATAEQSAREREAEAKAKLAEAQLAETQARMEMMRQENEAMRMSVSGGSPYGRMSMSQGGANGYGRGSQSAAGGRYSEMLPRVSERRSRSGKKSFAAYSSEFETSDDDAFEKYDRRRGGRREKEGACSTGVCVFIWLFVLVILAGGAVLGWYLFDAMDAAKEDGDQTPVKPIDETPPSEPLEPETPEASGNTTIDEDPISSEDTPASRNDRRERKRGRGGRGGKGRKGDKGEPGRDGAPAAGAKQEITIQFGGQERQLEKWEAPGYDKDEPCCFELSSRGYMKGTCSNFNSDDADLQDDDEQGYLGWWCGNLYGVRWNPYTEHYCCGLWRPCACTCACLCNTMCCQFCGAFGPGGCWNPDWKVQGKKEAWCCGLVANLQPHADWPSQAKRDRYAGPWNHWGQDFAKNGFPSTMQPFIV